MVLRMKFVTLYWSIGLVKRILALKNLEGSILQKRFVMDLETSMLNIL